MAHLRSPKGTAIIGTYEMVPGAALIVPGTAEGSPEAGFTFDYTGETRMYWDAQDTVLRRRKGNKERVFIDDEGDEWTENQLALVEEA